MQDIPYKQDLEPKVQGAYALEEGGPNCRILW